jgi:hypothetical protein
MENFINYTLIPKISSTGPNSFLTQYLSNEIASTSVYGNKNFTTAIIPPSQGSLNIIKPK